MPDLLSVVLGIVGGAIVIAGAVYFAFRPYLATKPPKAWMPEATGREIRDGGPGDGGPGVSG